MAGFDFEGTPPKLFWPEIFENLLPGAELNQMLILIMEIKSETRVSQSPCYLRG